MTIKINGKNIGDLAEAILIVGAKSAVHFTDEKTVVKGTRRGKIDKRRKHVEILFSIGPPNFRERQMIGRGKKGDNRKVLGRTFYTYYPKKK